MRRLSFSALRHLYDGARPSQRGHRTRGGDVVNRRGPRCLGVVGVVAVVIALALPATPSVASVRPHVLTLGAPISPQVHGNNALLGDSCLNALFCMAVRFQTVNYASNDRALMERWNETI